MTIAEKLFTVMYHSWPYDVWLGRRAPSAIEGPSMQALLSAEAAWHADGAWPITQPPKNETTGNFRWLSAMPLGADGGILNRWLVSHHRWNAQTWRADIAGERLVRWLDAYITAGKTVPEELKISWAVAILRTAKHLNRIKTGNGSAWRYFFVHQGRIAAALMIPNMRATLPAALARLGIDVDAQILPDGGHMSRAPQIALTVLAILIEIQTMLLAHHIEPPAGLVSAIDRMVPFIKAMLFGDGGFALMGGATDASADLIERVITASASKARAMTSGNTHRVSAHPRRADDAIVRLRRKPDTGRGPPCPSIVRSRRRQGPPDRQLWSASGALGRGQCCVDSSTCVDGRPHGIGDK